ncbi:DUF4304 domain-containing protein [Microbulbifer yueqingensis]|uniref:DUF4304 domain-containing protein n=1 Tax=Microbulbifer yueqingensis TaxID=658219 RepID=A0A1G9EHW5_9GAMM|nr:DUF4304 domain-containing protein [Microbulbifer yueqingensis]SDK75651.1 protein of unknown function [Microbulbifer yueqingensis]
MIAVLKNRVVPRLRKSGFSGRFPHFRRYAGESVHLLTFQFDRRGGGFVVEVAACPAAGARMHWGETVPAEKVTAHDVQHRLRLGADGPGADHWSRYDTKGIFFWRDPCHRVADELLPLLDGQAEQYWRKEAARW